MSTAYSDIGEIVETFDVDVETDEGGRFAIHIDPEDVAEKLWSAR